MEEQTSPNYYTKKAIQPIEYIRSNNLDFFEGNVFKYITRYKSKNGLEDLKKAKHYLEMIIEHEERLI